MLLFIILSNELSVNPHLWNVGISLATFEILIHISMSIAELAEYPFKHLDGKAVVSGGVVGARGLIREKCVLSGRLLALRLRRS
jgi:hypothetical protein